MNNKQYLVKHNYEIACKDYARSLCDLWDITPSRCFWVGNDIGGVYVVDDFMALNMDDLRYVVNNKISYSDFSEWLDYNVNAIEYNFDTLNLNAWHNGAPRVPKSTFERLDGLKKQFEKAVLQYGKEEEEKQKG